MFRPAVCLIFWAAFGAIRAAQHPWAAGAEGRRVHRAAPLKGRLVRHSQPPPEQQHPSACLEGAAAVLREALSARHAQVRQQRIK